jgi:hypothetical protein
MDLAFSKETDGRRQDPSKFDQKITSTRSTTLVAEARVWWNWVAITRLQTLDTCNKTRNTPGLFDERSKSAFHGAASLVVDVTLIQ